MVKLTAQRLTCVQFRPQLAEMWATCPWVTESVNML